MKLLENKTAFITGGSRGIGAALVETFARNGADVAFSYLHHHEAAKALLDDIAPLGGHYRAWACDVRDVSAVQQTLDAFLSEFGRIDILVNNAGIIRDTLLAEMSDEDWQQVMLTHLDAAFFHTRIALKAMIRQRSGAILNIASLSALTGMEGQANYAAAKAGLIGFTKSVAREAGPRNVRCNAIAPGLIETGMTDHLVEKKIATQPNIPLRKLGRPHEVADVALFLVSDLARYVTGQVISVCGGLY